MAESDQPKKETVRIELPAGSAPAANPPETDAKRRETVRIQMPVREAGDTPTHPSASPDAGAIREGISSGNFFSSPQQPSVPKPSSASLRSTPAAPSSGPKRETVRIPLVPEPLRSAQKKTQPLIAMPQSAPQNPPISLAPAEKSSMTLYWVLLGVSAFILIIQIWTYFS